MNLIPMETDRLRPMLAALASSSVKYATRSIVYVVARLPLWDYWHLLPLIASCRPDTVLLVNSRPSIRSLKLCVISSIAWHSMQLCHHLYKVVAEVANGYSYHFSSSHFPWDVFSPFSSTCQQFNIDQSSAKPSYIPTEGPKSLRPFANCSMDLITNLPRADRYVSILVMVDQGLSKGVILLPCNKMLASEDTACLLLKNLYKQFGLPDKIISDRGPQFASKAFMDLLKLLGIKSALSMAYHPQTDRTTEWVNQEHQEKGVWT